MGRREKPLDPGAGAVQRFAFEMRKLRDEAGTPTYRAMAARAGYSAPTLSAAAAGERLPTLPVLLAYVAACDGDPGSGSAGGGRRPPSRPVRVRSRTPRRTTAPTRDWPVSRRGTGSTSTAATT